MSILEKANSQQQDRNETLIDGTNYLGKEIVSKILPLKINVEARDSLGDEQDYALQALQIEAARTAIRALASLAEIGEQDHLGGGLDLIPSLLMTLSVMDEECKTYTIEHAHTSIGYYAALSAMGYLDPEKVEEGFRRGLDLPGHVAWLPGGTQMNGGRLGVMIPVSVGNALGKRAIFGDGSWVVTHCGDAGWISGQALNGFNGAKFHGAPVTFVMHRNGIQLSGSTRSIMDVDPRNVIQALGIEILEIPSLCDNKSLYVAYREAYLLAQKGQPSLIYPVGYRSDGDNRVDLSDFGKRYGILEAVEMFAAEQGVSMDQEIWIPGSLMSFRDIGPMIESVFLVNDLPGGHCHHDGHMVSRDKDEVLAGPMFRMTEEQAEVLENLRNQDYRCVVTAARKEPGKQNLVLSKTDLQKVDLPGIGEEVSARSGSEAGYVAVASAFPEQVFVVSCDLDASTKLEKARNHIPLDHQFEMSIEEQAASLIANGLATSTQQPQLNVVSTFSAFFEGIAREGFDMWQYQRNLTGVNEGLNVTYHLSHVGACTGRDHFSGWGLDWINLGLNYLPYLQRFYAPSDARAAFLAVVDLAANTGGHIIGIPRDNLPILERQDGLGPLWKADEEWKAVTPYRMFSGAKRAIFAFGAPAFLAGDALKSLEERGITTDVIIVNGLPLSENMLEDMLSNYSEGVVTIEDGKIGVPETGLRGFAGLVASTAKGIPTAHVGITDPRIAPSDSHMGTWAHFGITSGALVSAVEGLPD